MGQLHMLHYDPGAISPQVNDDNMNIDNTHPHLK